MAHLVELLAVRIVWLLVLASVGVIGIGFGQVLRHVVRAVASKRPDRGLPPPGGPRQPGHRIEAVKQQED